LLNQTSTATKEKTPILAPWKFGRIGHSNREVDSANGTASPVGRIAEFPMGLLQWWRVQTPRKSIECLCWKTGNYLRAKLRGSNLGGVSPVLSEGIASWKKSLKKTSGGTTGDEKRVSSGGNSRGDKIGRRAARKDRGREVRRGPQGPGRNQKGRKKITIRWRGAEENTKSKLTAGSWCLQKLTEGELIKLVEGGKKGAIAQSHETGSDIQRGVQVPESQLGGNRAPSWKPPGNKKIQPGRTSRRKLWGARNP